MDAGAPPIPIRAKWFNGRSSRAQEVQLTLVPSTKGKGPALLLELLAPATPTVVLRFEPDQVEWPPLWSASRVPQHCTLALQAQGSVQIEQPELWRLAMLAAGVRQGWAQRMQMRWSVLLGALVLAALLLVVFYRWGTPWAAARLAQYVPLEWELKLSQEALQQFDHLRLRPSQLDESRRAKLQTDFQALLSQLDPKLRRYPNYNPRYELLFRRGLGANAFALPGGVIVLSDELVLLADHAPEGENALLGVLAHEIGHVELRHATRLLVEQGVLNVGLGLALGDVSSVVALSSTLLTSLSYRRQHEAESDCFAQNLILRAQRPLAPMADFLLSLGREHAANADTAKGESRAASRPMDWLSTHPSTPQRAELLRAGQACRP